MDNQKFEIDKYKYTAKSVDFKNWIKIRAFFVSLLGRKTTLRVFCQKNKIDYPVISGKHYALPDTYQIEHNEITRMAKVRDRIIQGLYEEYKNTQQRIESEIKKAETGIVNNENILGDEKRRLDSYKRKKKTSKDPQELLAINSWITTTSTAIKNLENDINDEKTTCELLEKTKKENVESWGQQIEIVRATEDIQNHDFILNLTKGITNKLGFKEFSYNEIDFSDAVNKIIDGEYDAQ